MNNKFWFLTKMSLQKKMKNKTFVIVNILLLVVFVALINIDKIVLSFGGNFDKQNNIMVLDNTNKTYEIFKETIDKEETFIDTKLKYKVKKVNDEKKAKKSIKKDEDILLIVNNDEDNIINVTMITNGYINSNLYQLISSSITASKQNLAMKEINISAEELDKISKSVEIKREYIEKNKSKEEEQTEFIMGIVTPIVIFPFFMLITLVVQMVGAEINEEKSTRSMEIIISNVSPKTHFMSKVISSNLFVIIQGLLLVIFVVIGIVIRYFVSGGNLMGELDGEVTKLVSSISLSGVMDTLTYMIPIMIVILLLTFLAYSLLAGVLASMTTNLEDFQQLQTPIVIVLLAGYYLSMMAGVFKGSVFIRIMSYIPFVSSLLAPTLYVMGEITY